MIGPRYSFFVSTRYRERVIVAKKPRNWDTFKLAAKNWYSDHLSAGNHYAGPFSEANSGMRDNRPYSTYYSNGVFLGYDNGSVWVYFKTPNDVNVEWGRDDYELANNQAFLSNIIDAIAKELEVSSEKTRKDDRVQFHLLQVREDLTELEGYEGMTPAHADFLSRIQKDRFVRPMWHNYFGVRLKSNDIFYDTYGMKEKVDRWIDAVTNPADINFQVYAEDYDFIYDICVNKNRMIPLDFTQNPEDFVRLTATYGVGDDFFNKPPDIRNTTFQVPAHNESIITPRYGEISFRIVSPIEGDFPFMAAPNDGQTKFANAYFDPSSSIILSSIRGEIRAPKVAKNILDNKMSNAEHKAFTRPSSDSSYEERKETYQRMTNTQLAEEVALNGAGFLDNVEMIVAQKVGASNKAYQYFNQQLSYYGLTSRTLTERQHDALCSTMPTASRPIMPYYRNNIKRNPNTNQFFSGVLAMSGLLRSTKPCGAGGLFLGLSDSTYDYKEIYAPHGHVNKVSDRSKNQAPVILITGATGSGKALPLETPLALYKGGTVTMGEVKVGDVLISPTGKPSPVSFVTETQYNHECFEVRLSDGRTIIADANHQWLVNDSFTRSAVQRGVSAPFNHMMDQLYRAAIASLTTAAHSPAELPKRCPWDVFIPMVNGILSAQGGVTTFFPDIKAAIQFSVDGERGEMVDTREALSALALRLTHVWFGSSFPDSALEAHKIPGMYKYTTRELISVIRAGRKPGIFSTLPIQYESTGALTSQVMTPGLTRIPHDILYTDIPSRIDAVNRLIDLCDHTIYANSIHLTIPNDDLRSDALQLIRGLGVVASLKHSNVIVFTPWWSVNDTFFKPVNFFQHKTVEIVDIVPVQSVPVRCLTVDNPQHAFLLGNDYTVTSNTIQMTMMALQTIAMGLPMFFINPKPKSSLAPIFQHYGATVINMDEKYLLEQPGMLDPVYFIKDRKRVARILRDMIKNSMNMNSDTPVLSQPELDALMVQLTNNAMDPRNTCSHDIIMGNKRDHIPHIENEDVLDFVRNKLEISPFWKAFISMRTDSDSLIRDEIYKGKPVLVEWGDSMPMPNVSDERKWSEENMEAVMSVVLIFNYAAEVIGKDNVGGGLYIDEASHLQKSEESMSVLRDAGRQYREKYIDIILGTQRIADFASTESQYDISSYCNRFLLMKVPAKDAEDMELFYRITELQKNAATSKYINTAGISSQRKGMLPKAVYVDTDIDWRGGIQCGPWPERELALATAKDLDYDREPIRLDEDAEDGDNQQLLVKRQISRSKLSVEDVDDELAGFDVLNQE